MPFSINDPAVQAQLQTDYANGVVPLWNPNILESAQAFVDYWNNLTDSEAVTLVTHTYYSFQVEAPEDSEG